MKGVILKVEEDARDLKRPKTKTLLKLNEWEDVWPETDFFLSLLRRNDGATA
jgi:hypothetical protein